MILYECLFGRERRAIEIPDDPSPFEKLTPHKARELRRKWRTGIRRLHPKTYQIDEPDLT